MNYETTMDLSGAPGTRVEEIEIDGRRARRRRIVVVVAIAAVLMALAAWMMSRGGDEGNALDASARNAPPTVTVVQPGRTTVTGLINATG